MAERKQQNRDLTEMEVIDSGSKESAAQIDATGRRNGRGDYLCPSMDCWKKAVKSKGLERSLKMAIPKEVYEALEKEMEQFGES